jgi:predicted MFS family arabinose efflux permease
VSARLAFAGAGAAGVLRGPAVRGTALAAAVSTIGILPAYLVGALGPQIRADLGVGPSALGLALSVCFISQALLAAPLGRFVDRIGPRPSIRLAAVATSIIAGTIAAITGSFGMLLAALAACGAVNGIAQLASSATIAGSIPERRQGTAFGIKESAKPAATLLCGFAVPVVTLVDWRWAFVACAALALTMLAPGATSGAARARRPARSRSAAGRPSAALVLLAIGAGLGSAVGTTVGTFLVETVTADGMSAAGAGALLAIGSATAVVIRIVIGVRADRLAGGHLLRVAALLAAGIPGFLLLATASGPLLVLGAMLAFGGGWGWAGLLNFAVVRRSQDRATTSAGVVLGGAAFGGGAGPLVFGLVAERWSYSTGWALCALLALAGALVVLAGREYLKRSNNL